MLCLFLFIIQSFGSFKIDLQRRGIQVKVSKHSHQKRAKSNEEAWYFVHFDNKPDYTLLAEKGIAIKTKNMINNFWYSLFLTPSQADYLSRIASLRVIAQNEKIIDQGIIKFSDFLQIETSTTFDSNDIKSTQIESPFIYKLNDNLYQVRSIDNQKLAQILSSNSKVYLISPKNKTLYLNNRAAGYTQLNTQSANLSGKSNNVITIDRPLQTKGLDGEGQVILVQDTYLDPYSTFFYDPKYQNFEKNHYYDDHRKINVIFDEFDYKNPRENEHGTHVAGCAAGSSHLPLSESDTSLYDGIAPKAKISFYQGGTSGIYNSEQVQNLVDKTKPCVCSNSWGYRSSSITDDNQWNQNAKQMNNTLFVFAGGNYGQKNNPTLDFYETLTSPGTGKNLLTVGAASSIPIEGQNDDIKQIYFFQSMLQQTFSPKVEKWSLNRGNLVNTVDYLFTEGSVEMFLTYDPNEENLAQKNKILIINGKEGFELIQKENPPAAALTPIDFDIDNFESLGFSQLFPVLKIDNDTIATLYSNYGRSVEVETNYVDSKLASVQRAPFSSKGLSSVGLMKPDIVTPGTAMFSARSDPNGERGHADIAIMDGTSMAAPNLAGATALASQYFTDKRYRSSLSITPSSSLLRSLLINAADPLNVSAPYPNADTGFGILNLGKYILTGNSRESDDEFVLIGDNIPVVDDQHLVTEIEVKDNTRDFRVTISYLDEVLSDDSSAALAIDLDLIIIGPDETIYRGNQRPDNTEEMFSTNERVIINKNDLKPGKYEIHIISHVPDVVPTKSAKFSITVFGSISYAKGNMITFEKAQKCIPVVAEHGQCNEETTLNECQFDDYNAYTGHSCQNEVVILIEESKILFELEPYGTKYVNVFYPFDAEFSKLTIMIASATPFSPKYAYTLNSTGLKHPMRELDAENVLMNKDVLQIIDNHGQAEAWKAQSCLFTLVYNKSPKKTIFIASYQIEIDDDTGEDITPTPTPPPPPPSSTNADIVDSKVIKEVDSYFIPFIIVIVACVVLFVIIVILAFFFRRTSKNGEAVTESLKSSIF